MNRQKQLVGIVVSDRMEKTIVVRVMRLFRHPVYQRVIRRFKKFKAHDPEKEAHLGDEVKIGQTRPLSKEKRWRLVQILRRGLKSTPFQKDQESLKEGVG